MGTYQKMSRTRTLSRQDDEDRARPNGSKQDNHRSSVAHIRCLLDRKIPSGSDCPILKGDNG
jgi:hypothetical protein